MINMFEARNPEFLTGAHVIDVFTNTQTINDTINSLYI